MSILVGFDRSEKAEAALRAALERASDEDRAVHIVYVVSQVELDQTGRLTAEEKRSAILERAYPEVWKHVNEIVEAASVELPELSLVEMHLHIRFAPVHLTRVQERTAAELFQTAVDFKASHILLGRVGRPGSVLEHLLSSGQFDQGEGSAPVVLTARGGALNAPKSSAWKSKA